MSLVVAKIPLQFFRALLQVTRDETSSRHEIIWVLKSEVMQTPGSLCSFGSLEEKGGQRSPFLGGNRAQEIQCNAEVKTKLSEWYIWMIKLSNW